MSSKYEYLYADVHSSGGRTWLEHLNALGARGWRVVDVDADTTEHKRVLLEREIPEEKDDGRKEGLDKRA